MIFAKLDVDITDHPKAIAAGPGPFGIWAWALAYCRKHELDGVVPAAALRQALGGRPENVEHAAALMSVGLFLVRADGDFTFANYAKKNETKDDVSRRRTETKNRVAKLRKTEKSRYICVTPSVTGSVTSALPSPVTVALVPGSGSDSGSGSGSVSSLSDPDPELPPPTASLLTEYVAEAKSGVRAVVPKAKRARSRATQTLIPLDWQPSGSDVAKLADEGHSDPVSHVPRFIDHWRSKGEMRADWEATFRNWVRGSTRFPSGRQVAGLARPGGPLIQSAVGRAWDPPEGL